jgi:hypothetical protein
MDSSDGSLSASALFSPSKARQQRALAQDWAHVDTWLSTQYGGRIPSFERNDETLRELLSLVAANERAGEEDELMLTTLHDIEQIWATAEVRVIHLCDQFNKINHR